MQKRYLKLFYGNAAGLGNWVISSSNIINIDSNPLLSPIAHFLILQIAL